MPSPVFRKSDFFSFQLRIERSHCTDLDPLQSPLHVRGSCEKGGLALTSRRRAVDVGKHNNNNNDKASLYNYDDNLLAEWPLRPLQPPAKERVLLGSTCPEMYVPSTTCLCPCVRAYSGFHIVREPLRCYDRQHPEALNFRCLSCQAVTARQLLRSDVEEQYIDSARSPP